MTAEELREEIKLQVERGKLPVLAGVSGIPAKTIKQFIKTGEISPIERGILETLAA